MVPRASVPDAPRGAGSRHREPDMFTRILVPTDGSELSLRAAQGAVEMAHRIGARIVALTVVEPYA